MPHPPLKIYLLLFLAVMSASQSGNIIRLGQASPVVITMWRLTLAALFFLPLSRIGQFDYKKLKRLEQLSLVVCGVCLALHFYCWIHAVQLTTVANAAIVFSLNPILIALFELLFFKERIHSRIVAAFAIGLVGGVIVGREGVMLSGSHVAGVVSALGSAFFFAGYFLSGRYLRRVMPTYVYVISIYAVAALISLVVILVEKMPLMDYSPQTWLCFVLMALVPTVMGHTSYNYALGHLNATWVSVLTLAEPPLAALVALWVWHEPITWSALIGFGLIAVSTLLLLFAPSQRVIPLPDN
jgi:drug/metabolite transporter (DMT)-like permease